MIHFLLAALCSHSVALAQADAVGSQPGSDANYELGLHLGSFLPDQINGVREIMGLGGARVGFRLAQRDYLEFGVLTGNGQGQTWKNANVDIRLDVPIENLVGIGYVGLDANYYSGLNSSTRLIFGGHLGGGLMANLLGSCWVRADMKFGVSPGTSLYIGLGLMWRLGSGGTSSGS